MARPAGGGDLPAGLRLPETDGDLHLQRILRFLPFLVIGLRLRREHFELVPHRAVRPAAGPVLLTALAFAYWSATRMNQSWFYRNDSDQEPGVPWWVGAPTSLALTVGSLVPTVCFLALVPRRRAWFTALGAGTLHAYPPHGFSVLTARFLGWYDMAWVATPAGETAVSAVAAVLAVVPCTPPVRRLLRPVVEPNVERVFRRDAAEPARERSAGTAEEPVRGRSDPGRRPTPARRRTAPAGPRRVPRGPGARARRRRASSPGGGSAA